MMTIGGGGQYWYWPPEHFDLEYGIGSSVTGST